MAARVVIKVLGEYTNSNVLVVPQRLADGLRVRAGTLTIKAGQAVVEATAMVGRQDSRPQRIYMSKELQTALSLAAEDYLLVWWDSRRNVLRVGPVIGVMGRRYRNGLFGETTEIIRWCVRLARLRGALAYAFGPQDIDWETRTVRGLVWTGKGLRRVRCPLPDVVYDRVSSRTAEMSKAMVRAKERLLGYPDLKYYNRTFFNKWDLHKMLEKHATTKAHLPSTEELTDQKVLETYLRRYGVVFVKPTQGSLGAGIFRVARVSGGYSYRITRLNHPDTRGRARSMARILAIAERLMKKGQYVVQRGLKLAHVNGGPFDVRVLMQKSTRNTWTVQSMVARVAQPGNVVSNISDGGYILNPRRAIALAFGGRVRPSLMTMKLRRVARAAARAIEAEMGFEFAEMGIDLAVDTNARVWIIEANSRPGRETGTEGPRRVSSSVVRLVRFLRSRGLQ